MHACVIKDKPGRQTLNRQVHRTSLLHFVKHRIGHRSMHNMESNYARTYF
jgi:hypothetical protein